MLKKIKCVILASALFALTACGSGAAIDNEIKIPIYNSGGEDKVTTDTVQYRDLSETKSVGAEIGYVYAVDVCSTVSGNLVSFNVERAKELKEGDTVAVLDSSSLDYEYQSQKLLTDNAYNNYANFGGEKNRLIYEENKLLLEQIQYKIDCYTIKAPYDCTVIGIGRFETGASISANTAMCTVVKTDEIYVYATSDTGSFALGTKAEIKLSTEERYKVTVVSVPESIKGNEKYGTLREKGVNINKAVIFALDEGERERLLTDIPNAVSAGWATIYVTSKEKNNVLTVPNSAVKQFSGEVYCNVIENGQRIQVPVETGESISGYTIILSGLTEGDTIVI